MDQLLNHVSDLIVTYHSLPLFFLLAFGIIGLPIPDETLLAFTGWLIAQNKLSWYSGFLALYFGSICGITVNYCLGRTACKYLVKKYGPIIGITHAKILRVHNWFERIGKWSLFIGYFIPGVRHLTGYVAGTTTVEYRLFAIFAYLGGLFWVTIFMLMGYFLGEKIFTLLHQFDQYISWLILITLMLAIFYYIWKKM